MRLNFLSVCTTGRNFSLAARLANGLSNVTSREASALNANTQASLSVRYLEILEALYIVFVVRP